jgi:hypothetical protein
MASFGAKEMPAMTVEQVLKRNTGTLMSLPGVVGAAEGRADGKPCVNVYVVAKTLEVEQDIPQLLEGFPVVVRQAGELKSLGGVR